MSTMHTPGPWFLDDAQPGDRFRYVMAGKGDAFGYICRISTNGNANPEADARLIAAAPELLEALIAITTARCDGMDPTPINEAYEKADAAIAKATGEPA